MMRKSLLKLLAAGFFYFIIPAIAGTVLAADTAPRITKEDARAMLGNPAVFFIDVRQGRDWESSKSRIKGAVRESPEKPEAWVEKYPKEKTLILYCA